MYLLIQIRKLLFYYLLEFNLVHTNCFQKYPKGGINLVKKSFLCTWIRAD